MKRVFLLVAVMLSMSASAKVWIVRPDNPAHEQYGQRLLDVRDSMQRLEDQINAMAGPGTVKNLIFKGCDGQENAYFEHGTANIFVCYEYLDMLARKRGEGSAEAARDQFLAMVHAILHEAGHAISAARGGRLVAENPERSADAIAAALIDKAGMRAEFLQAILSARSKGALWDDMRRPLGTNDPHPLEISRRADAICWIGGNDRQILSDAVAALYITPARASGCAQESAQVMRLVDALIAQR